MSIFNSMPVFGGRFFSPLVHGGGEDGTGVVGLLDSLLDTASHWLSSGEGFTLFPGIAALGSNIHPMIVHFPIGLLTVYFFLELFGMAVGRTSLRNAASWLLYIGAIGAVAAAGAGLVAEATVPHGEDVHDILEWHRRVGLTAASLSIILVTWRILKRELRSIMARALYLFLAGMMTLLLFIGADLGGLMVYQHGVGVQKLQEPDDHQHGALESSSTWRLLASSNVRGERRKAPPGESWCLICS